jgi:protein-tyrosine-phosphatase
MSSKKNILFVCIENSNRSQMAEAFARMYGEGKVSAFSAGSRPSGHVNPKAIEAMKMLGYDLSNHQSKSVDDFRKMSFEYVVTMGCGDECPFILSKYYEDWSIPDPKNLPMKEFISVRDIIESKVKQLLDKIVND